MARQRPCDLPAHLETELEDLLDQVKFDWLSEDDDNFRINIPPIFKI